VLRKFFKCENGNYAVITVIAMMPIMTAVAGVVDYTTISRDAAALQNALDAAALAIGTQYHSAMSQSDLENLGYQALIANMRILNQHDGPVNVASSDTLVGAATNTESEFSASASGSGYHRYIAVSSSITHQGFVGALDWMVSRQAVVRVSGGQEACVLALNPHVSKAMQLQGSATVTMAGCVIASNSDAADSFYRGGNATLSAICATSAGGAKGLDTRTTLQCGQPLTRQQPTVDPLEGVAPPAYGNCINVPNDKTATLSQGTFCGSSLSGEVTLNPGTYIFKGVQLSFNGNDSLVGNGVTIFLMQGSTLTINGNATTDLSPPTSGPYAGITIYQARDNAAELKLNGTSDISLTGYVYAPAAAISYKGNSSTTNQSCMRIIGDTVTMTGNSNVKSNCSAELGNRLMYAGRSITLVK
jgi:hypothetical protein